MLAAYDKGKLKSVATKAELARFREAARTTGMKSRPVNARTVAAVKAGKAGRSSPASLDDLWAAVCTA